MFIKRWSILWIKHFSSFLKCFFRKKIAFQTCSPSKSSPSLASVLCNWGFLLIHWKVEIWIVICYKNLLEKLKIKRPSKEYFLKKCKLKLKETFKDSKWFIKTFVKSLICYYSLMTCSAMCNGKIDDLVMYNKWVNYTRWEHITLHKLCW